MKILVINPPFLPGFCRTQRWPSRTRGRALRPPDWLAYCTAVLEKDGHQVKLFDFPAQGGDKKRLAEAVAAEKPELVVLDTTTPSINSDLDCARLCKQASGCRVVMVGTHATIFPEETLKEGAGAVDLIARGEYEYSVRDAARHFSGHPDDSSALSKIEGVSYLHDGAVVNNPDRPAIENLDELPFPAWRHLKIRDYFDATKRYPFLDVIGSRGCPHSCAFCLWPQVMHGRKQRRRSVDNILAEIEHDLKTWPEIRSGEFFFEDDSFTLDPDWVKRFCEALLSSGWGIAWSANCRPDFSDYPLLKKMRDAGCRMLMVGYESGNPRMLRAMGKRLEPMQSREFTRLAKKAGLKIHGCFLLGFPGEDPASLRDTLSFALALPIDTVQFSAAVPYPGTDFYRICRENNFALPASWEEWLDSGEQAAVFGYPGLSRETISRSINRGLARFYFRPRTILNNVLSMESFSDLYRQSRGALNLVSSLLKT